MALVAELTPEMPKDERRPGGRTGGSAVTICAGWYGSDMRTSRVIRGTQMYRLLYGHLGEVRHRSEVVEFRVEQHLARLVPLLTTVG